MTAFQIAPEYTLGFTKPVSEDRFDDMLETLPPAHWVRSPILETFVNPERLSGDVCMQFGKLKYDDKVYCFQKNVIPGDESTWMTSDEVRQAYELA